MRTKLALRPVRSSRLRIIEIELEEQFSLALSLLTGLVAASPLDFSVEKRQSTAPSVKITKITYSGSGCPAGSASTQILAGGSTYQLIYDSFLAQVPPGAATTNTVNCNVQLTLSYPQGIRFGALGSNTRGFAQLSQGVTGSRSTSYTFGLATVANPTSTFTGPTADDYTKTDNVNYAGVTLSPCSGQGTLNINTVLSVSNRGNAQGQGQISIDGQDGKLNSTIAFNFVKC